jgi:hypothetical protein
LKARSNTLCGEVRPLWPGTEIQPGKWLMTLRASKPSLTQLTPVSGLTSQCLLTT